MARSKKTCVGYSNDSKLKAITEQLYSCRPASDGTVSYVRNGKTLNLEDMAFVRWCRDGKPARGPMTKMGELKREAKVLEKVKLGLQKCGYTKEDIHELIAMYSHSGRKCAECCSRVECDE